MGDQQLRYQTSYCSSKYFSPSKNMHIKSNVLLAVLSIINFYFLFKALSVPSSGGDSWTKQVSYTGSEPNSEVPLALEIFVIEYLQFLT